MSSVDHHDIESRNNNIVDILHCDSKYGEKICENKQNRRYGANY